MKKNWIFIGAIIVIILLIGIGYKGYQLYHNKMSQSFTSTQSPIEGKTMRIEPTIITSNSVYNIMPSGKLGPIFTDTKGMTLYTFKNDVPGMSHCLEGCLKVWPAYTASSQTGSFPTNITVIKRSDGTLQYAWKEMPLYYYVNDKKAGDVNGEGIGGVWFVVK